MPLQVFQSMWGMIGLPHGSDREWAVEEQLDRIIEAGYDGVSVSFHDPESAARTSELARKRGLGLEVVCYCADQRGFDELLSFLHATKIDGISHVNMQPMVRTTDLAAAAELVQGWLDSAAEAGAQLLIETHRGRLTNDLPFTLDLIDAVPGIRFTADLSHYVTSQEFALPVTPENEAAIETILNHSGAFHGRVAAPGQIQIQTSFPHHAPLVVLFARWWAKGFAMAAQDPSRVVTFTTELGPASDWYAATGPDGKELSDRWQEALQLKDLALSAWPALDPHGGVLPEPVTAVPHEGGQS